MLVCLFVVNSLKLPSLCNLSDNFWFPEALFCFCPLPEIQDCGSPFLLCTFCDCPKISSRRLARKRSNGHLSSCLWNYNFSSWRKSFPLFWVLCAYSLLLLFCGSVGLPGAEVGEIRKKQNRYRGFLWTLGVTIFLLLRLESEGFFSNFILSIIISEHFWVLGLWIQPGWYQWEQKQ